MGKRHHPTRDLEERSFEEEDRLHKIIDGLKVNRTAGEIYCSSQCHFFRHFSKRTTPREGSNAGRCPVVGKEVHAGFTVCERLRV